MIDTNMIKNVYEEDSQVKRYSKAAKEIGLWESEKILFSKYFKKGQKILDIGCGAGRTTIALYKLGFKKIIGLDLSENLINSAISIASEENLKLEFIIGSALSLKLQDNSFEGAIFSFNGFMQIPGKCNRLAALKEVSRVLNKSSYFIFTTHTGRQETGLFVEFWEEYNRKWNSPEKDKRLLDYGDRFFYEDNLEQFIHIPTQNEVKSLISDAGLKLIEFTKRSEICDERKEVLDYSLDCIFWITCKE